MLKKTSHVTGKKSEAFEGDAACEKSGVWVKRCSLSVSGSVPDLATAASYRSTAADPVEMDLNLKPWSSSIDPVGNETTNSDSSILAIADLRSQCLRMNHELRSLHIELTNLRREVRLLRIQHVESR